MTNKFSGFPAPAQNYSKLPHAFIGCLPIIDSMSELKIVIYLLRHTWGYNEYGKPKRITTDEFMHGRKRRDGERLDGGTGLSNNSVISGLEKAIEHGFVLVQTDDSDKARIEKCYCLNMSDVQDLHSQVKDLHSDYAEFAQRSEKETKERKQKKEKRGASATPKATDIPEVVLFHSVTERYPSKDTFKVVADAVQKISARLNRAVVRDDLLPFWEAWRIKDYKKTNLSWLTDWAVAGKITQNGNGKHKPNIDNIFAEYARENGM